MTKAIRSYPEKMQSAVVARRMRQYDPKGPNGLGVLSAKAVYDKQTTKRITKAGKLLKEAKK